MLANITIQTEDLVTGVASSPVTATIGFDVIYLKGDKGNSAYEDAVEQGYTGTLEQWLESLHGDDGFSPSASVAKVEDTATISITDKNGTTSTTIKDGKDGDDGISPQVSVHKDNGVVTITITDKEGVHSATISDGTDGTDGDDGVSPTANVVKSGNTATITITDKNGISSASISDGADGNDGISPTVSTSKSNGVTTVTITDKNGSYVATIDDGEDGYSPSASVTQTSSGAIISVTDKNGTTTAEVSNGTQGNPGVSPAVTIAPIQGGHRMTVTDAEHPQGQSFDVMDGQGGGISDAPSDGKAYVRKDGGWSDDFEVVKTDLYGSTITSEALNLGTQEESAYYNNNGKKTAYTGSPKPVVYAPINLSEYIGSYVEITVTWGTYTDTSWSNIALLKANGNVDSAGSVGRYITEREAYNNRTNNSYTFNLEITSQYPYLYLSSRNASTTISVRIVSVEIVGKLASLYDNMSVVYIATDGSDTDGNGTEAKPYATINKALENSNNIVIKGGVYEWAQIDLDKCMSKKISVYAKAREKVKIMAGSKIAGAVSKESGYNNVYSIASTLSFNCHWIYQWGVADANTLIREEERTAYHGRRTYRCDYTALIKVNSVQEVEDSTVAAFYSDGSKLYFSGVSVSSDNYLFQASATPLLLGTLGKTLTMCGLSIYGRGLNLDNLKDSVLTYCSVHATKGSYAISIYRSVNLMLDRCEASHAETDGSSSTGDGFNAHTNKSVDETNEECFFILKDCYSHDNWNDGYSDHEGCRGIIEGGLFEYNCLGGTGAGLTPAYGAHDVIRNAICQYNNANGLMYVGDGSAASYQTGSYGSCTVVSCLSRNNRLGGYAMPQKQNNKAIGDFINCVASDNGTDFIRGNSIMRCLNCKASDSSLD